MGPALPPARPQPSSPTAVMPCTCCPRTRSAWPGSPAGYAGCSRSRPTAPTRCAGWPRRCGCTGTRGWTCCCPPRSRWPCWPPGPACCARPGYAPCCRRSPRWPRCRTRSRRRARWPRPGWPSRRAPCCAPRNKQRRGTGSRCSSSSRSAPRPPGCAGSLTGPNWPRPCRRRARSRWGACWLSCPRLGRWPWCRPCSPRVSWLPAMPRCGYARARAVGRATSAAWTCPRPAPTWPGSAATWAGTARCRPTPS